VFHSSSYTAAVCYAHAVPCQSLSTRTDTAHTVASVACMCLSSTESVCNGSDRLTHITSLLHACSAALRLAISIVQCSAPCVLSLANHVQCACAAAPALLHSSCCTEACGSTTALLITLQCSVSTPFHWSVYCSDSIQYCMLLHITALCITSMSYHLLLHYSSFICQCLVSAVH
jgi:hypothetical protein